MNINSFENFNLICFQNKMFSIVKRFVLAPLSACTLVFIFLFSHVALSNSFLIMFTDKGCPYCQAWERDIGTVYSKTEVAIQFPLTRITAKETESKFLPYLDEVRGTPTFIFFRDDLEIGRIEGYSDAEMFWWLVDDIIAQFKKTE